MPLHKPGPLLLANLLIMRQHLKKPTKEWIDKILQHLTKGSNPATASVESRHQYLHAVNSWIALYRREHAAKEALKNQVFDLQQELENLKTQLQGKEATSDGSLKRKKSFDGSTNVPTSLQAKKLKTHFSLFGHKTYLDATSRFKDCPMAGEERKTLMRHFFGLFNAVHEEQQNSDTIASHVALTASAADAAITSFCKKHDRYLGTSTGTFGPVLAANQKETNGFFHGLAPIIILLLRCLDKMDNAVPELNSVETSYSAAGLYETSRLFRSILVCFASACNAIAKYEDLTTQQTTESSANIHGLAPPSSTPHPASTKAADAISTLPDKLQQLLHDVLMHLISPREEVSSPVQTQSSRAALLEALTYLLLTRAGDHLHLFTFSHPRAPDIASSLSTAPAVAPADSDIARAMRSAELEAERLLPLLSCALRAAEEILVPSPSDPGTNASHPTDVVGTLLARPRATLQRTLLRGVFGKVAAAEPLARGWGADLGGLSMPARPAKGWLERAERAASRSGREDRDSGNELRDRFCSEMWSLCGWGILGGVFEVEGF